jgi:hypothetical protein
MAMAFSIQVEKKLDRVSPNDLEDGEKNFSRVNQVNRPVWNERKPFSQQVYETTFVE